MATSKSTIDKSGRLVASLGEITEESIEMEHIFDQYRASHLEPLTEITHTLQEWMHGYGKRYYIAQRLKRKPQIVRKLNRLHVRLTQLQDIGGCRIILDNNSDVDDIIRHIDEKSRSTNLFRIIRSVDYRIKGRDESGYRSFHFVMNKSDRFIELQIRSQMQHYWAESIERTSVIYGYILKEQEGSPSVVSYFKKLSDALHELESGRKLAPALRLELEKLREHSQDIVSNSSRGRLLDSYVNEDIVKTLASQQTLGQLNNWIIVFDWNRGQFLTWQKINWEPSEAIKEYVRYENLFRAEDNFEVVMIGSSDIATVRRTHSHYFGIDETSNAAISLNDAIIGFQSKMDIDIEARQILALLFRKKYWGRKAISEKTLKNHYLQDLMTFDSSLQALRSKGLVLSDGINSPVALNPKRRSDIEKYL